MQVGKYPTAIVPVRPIIEPLSFPAVFVLIIN